jgi:NADPH:quinone reductase-like Zn-dependent oxidoreductase
MGHAGRQGACAEYVAVPVERLYHLPDDIDPIRAVATFHPAATAYLGLHRRAEVRAGETVLIGGAAGSVGSCATRFAVDAGAAVVATARMDDHARCRALGAAHAFDYAADNLTELVAGVAPEGVDLYWDTSGHAELNDVIPMLRPGGTIVVTAGRQLQPPTSLWPLYTTTSPSPDSPSAVPRSWTSPKQRGRSIHSSADTLPRSTSRPFCRWRRRRERTSSSRAVSAAAS